MPAYGGPSRNMYDDAPSEDSSPMSEEQSSKQDESSPQTAVIPKEFFGDKELKPGARCEVEIQRVMDKEVLVKYVPHDEGEEKSESEAPAAESEAMPMEKPGMYD